MEQYHPRYIVTLTNPLAQGGLEPPTKVSRYRFTPTLPTELPSHTSGTMFK